MEWALSLLGGISVAALVLIAQWLIRILMIPVVIQRHTPAVATSWLAILFFEPFIGLFVYLLLGRQLVGRKRIQHHTEIARMVESRIRERTQHRNRLSLSDLPPHRRDLARLAQTLSGMPAVEGNCVELISSTDELIDRLVKDINEAEHHVHLLFYIFESDATGRRVAEAMARAAERGVVCRLLLDSQGSARALRELAGPLRAAGVHVAEALHAGLLRQRVARIDVRNHRKLVVIDGRIGYSGSQNIVDAHYGGDKVGPWRDLMMRVRGPVLTQLQGVFFEDWASETGDLLDFDDLLPELEQEGDALAIAVPSGPSLRAGAFRDISLSAINEADERVILTTPYLVLDESSLLALRIRAKAGIRVDIVVPEKSNNPLVDAASRSQYEDLLNAGVNIYLHHDGLLHAKSLSIDGAIALIGSGNMDRRSFSVNYELSLLMAGGSVGPDLVALQERYMSESRLLTAEEWAQRSRVDRYLQNTAKLFGALL
ncbi:MAG: cardiolipin synthase [Phycisphaerales bacterium]